MSVLNDFQIHVLLIHLIHIKLFIIFSLNADIRENPMPEIYVLSPQWMFVEYMQCSFSLDPSILSFF